MTQDAGHFVQFFASDARLIEAVGRYIHEGIHRECTCIVVATPEHREGIDAWLRSSGLNPATLSAEYRYISLDARTALASFMTEGRLDQQRFHRNAGLLVRQAAARGQPVRIFGEAVALLAADGNAADAIQLEELWNELSRHYSFTLYCGYPVTAFWDDARNYTLACATHSHVLPTVA